MIYFYPALNALTIFNLAARTEGRNPPINPINTAKIKEDIIIDGDCSTRTICCIGYAACNYANRVALCD